MNENETVMPDEQEIYEVSFILDNRLTEEKALEKLATLKKDIASLGGSFISEETPYLRELSYEMTRVINNVNVKFLTGYFGWLKFELATEEIAVLNKKLKLDEEIIRFLIVKAERGNDVFTKDLAVLKSDPILVNQNKEEEILEIEETQVDTTKDDDLGKELGEETKKELEEEIKNL